jgi:hypothetical protein
METQIWTKLLFRVDFCKSPLAAWLANGAQIARTERRWGGRKLLIEIEREGVCFVMSENDSRAVDFTGARAIIFCGLEPHAGLTAAAAHDSFRQCSKVVDVRVCCRCSGGRARCWPHNMHKLRAMQVSEQHISSRFTGLIICSVCTSPPILDDSHSLVLIDTISAAQRE